MTKKILLLLLLILPTFLFAQSSFSDPKSAKIVEKDCQHGVFTVVEDLPSLKVSKEKFEDTLATALRVKKFTMTNDEIIYKFLVTTQSKILDLKPDSGRVSQQKILKETIVQFADLWAPAKQSGRPVCAYVRLKIKFTNDTLNIAVSQ
jgi:hypothetical protein